MKTQLTQEICHMMNNHLSTKQSRILENTLVQVFSNFSLPTLKSEISSKDYEDNTRLINLFIGTKKLKVAQTKH